MEPFLVRLNIGCGNSPTPGWLNIDNSPSLRLGALPFVLSADQRRFLAAARLSNTRYGTATRLPVGDSVAEAIYSSHMLEHLDPGDARTFLLEAMRVLRPGGVLRIVVPDVETITRYYIEVKHDADWLMRTLQVGYERPRTVRSWLRAALFPRREHCWMYDSESLAKALAEVGFIDVKSPSSGETRIANPGALNLTEREEWSACVEGVRP